MNAFYFILLLLAAVCFALSAFNVVVARRVSFLSLGLLFWVLVPLIQTLKVL